MTRYVLADTETSGLGADDGVCEIAWMEIDADFNVIEFDSSLINPGIPIAHAASAVNGITDAMVRDAPTLEQYMRVRNYPLIGSDVVMIAHNASFDYRFLKEYMSDNGRTLCTLRCSRIIYPTAESHKQAALAYMLGFDIDRSKAHSADGDLDVLLQLLKRLCLDGNCSIDDLIELQKQPRQITKMPWGKHKGKPLSEVPASYVRWMLEDCENLDPDLRNSLVNL